MPNTPFKLDFAIVGVQKAATTALASYLAQHPDICLPETKETHFFRRPARRGPPADREMSHLTRHFAHCQSGQVCGDATPIYCYWPNALNLLHAHNPDLKCILSVRHPVARAYSAWSMEVRRGRESFSFSEAIRAGRSRVQNSPLKVHQIFSYVERGFYARQATSLLKMFPQGQVFALRSDEVSPQHPRLAELLSFLQIGPFEFTPIGQNVRPGSLQSETSLEEDFDFLQNLYADDLKRFQDLGLVDVSDWIEAPPDWKVLGKW
jgi:hypothetical protein